MRSANRVEKPSAHHHRFATFLARSQVCDKQPTTPKTFGLRRHIVCVGRSQRARPPTNSARFLAFHRAHQRQGINSGGEHHTIASQTQRNSGFGCGQRHRLFLFNKSRRQGSTVEQPSKTVSHLVDNASHRIACSARTVTPDVSRPHLSLVIRPKRIFSQPSHLQTDSRQVQKVLQAEHRHVRFSEQRLAAPLLCQVAASPSDPHRRFGMPTGDRKGLLRAPPLVTDSAMATRAQSEPPCDQSRASFLVGFGVMVAPINLLAREGNASASHSATVGPLSELSRSLHEETKMAPSLHSVIRQRLLARNFTEIEIEQHLKGLGALNRYQNAFTLLFAMALRDGLTINSPLDAFVGLLLELHAVSPSPACNAYSALLLVPGFHDVKYHPLLKQAEKAWNKHSQRYAAFWDPVPVFVAFLNISYDVKYIAHARIRLILLWRFLGLFRSIDLSRTKRQVSSIGERRFVVVQRKNKPDYRWEEILVLHLHAWSPWHALCTYVELTAPLVAPGSALLIALHRPYLPLTGDTIGSLTRRELQRLGVDTSVFGPHTTRGAFVECFVVNDTDSSEGSVYVQLEEHDNCSSPTAVTQE